MNISVRQLANALHDLWAPFLCTPGPLDMDDHMRQAQRILGYIKDQPPRAGGFTPSDLGLASYAGKAPRRRRRGFSPMVDGIDYDSSEQ